MSLDVAVWVDAIICDYNYVFDPQAHLRRFFGEGNKGDYLFSLNFLYFQNIIYSLQTIFYKLYSPVRSF